MKKEEFVIYNGKMKKTGSYRSEELPIFKNIIVEKSIYFFNDPAPCFIHRGAVIVRLSEEIKQYLEEKNEPVLIGSLPEEIRSYFDFGTEASYIEYCSNK